jgi:hypothetical protein
MYVMLIVLCLCCVGVYAADAVVPLAPVVSDPAAGGSTIISILHYLTDIILGGFLVLFGLGFKWLVSKAGENAARVQAIEALHAGVEHAWNELGANFKAASEDGKFTAEEKKKLRDMAIAKALEVAKGPGKDLLLNWGTEIISAKIRAIVDSRNSAAAITVPLNSSTLTVSTPAVEIK